MRRKANLANRIDEQTEAAVVAQATEFPAHGQLRTRNALRKRGVFVSASGVRSVWRRHGLENFKLRLAARVAALERKKHDDEACGEIETAHPGYLGSQDTFYVGALKGVGRVCQQTFVDTCSKVAFARPYATRTPIPSADLLNDQVLPFFENHALPVLRILTDRGTEYCGKVEPHDYQLYLAVNDIEHTRTRTRSPQTNGICERFHKTLLQEFCQVTFRRSCMRTSIRYRRIWMNGCGTITMNAPTRAKCVVAERRWIPWKRVNNSGRRSIYTDL